MTAGLQGGYRLKRLELFNWGTFDGDLFVVRPSGETALLVGQNGSGKSTLVDAILTLLVRPGVRNVNVAAGAKKTERDERSYIKGAYDRTENDAGHVELKFLRPRPAGYSIILACFASEQGSEFTVAQLLYLGSDQSVEKVYCFATTDRAVSDHLANLPAPDRLLRELREREWKATRTFAEYEGWLLGRIHAKPKAMDVLNQTVAVKDIQRLNEFIRQHMLESQPRDERVDQLLSHFGQLRDAHRSLVRAREQLELLTPIATAGAAYREKCQALAETEAILNAIDSFFAVTTREVVQPELEARELELQRLAKDKTALAERIDNLESQLRAVERDIESAGGERLRALPLLIEKEALFLQAKTERRRVFVEALERAGIRRRIDGDDDLAAVQSEMRSRRAAVTTERSEAERERDTLVVERASVRADRDRTQAELEGLKRRRGNIPQESADARESLCRQLGIQEGDLPFAAELIAVKPNETKWEASIEKALRAFGLTLLVPEGRYDVVTRYVNRTRLEDRARRGVRLTYAKVSMSSTPGAAEQRKGSMLAKLEFRNGHALLPWVKGELASRFDFRCCESIEDFQAERGLAMTTSCHLKFGDKRHEKDDSERAVDARFFILGWDNREKQSRLAARASELGARELELDSAVRKLEATVAVAGQVLQALDQAAVASFYEIDTVRHATEIAELEREKAQIETGSETIIALRRRADEITQQKRQANAERDDVLKSEERIDLELKDARKLLNNAADYLTRREADGLLARDRESFAAIHATLPTEPLTATTLVEAQACARKERSKEAEGLRPKVEEHKADVLAAMGTFMRKHPEESDLSARVEFLSDFIALQERIVREDLPRHEARFKERLNETVIQEIGLFRAGLESERRSVEQKIELLNTSLCRLEYRPGTHIRLEPRAVRDPEIVDFQAQLRQCIEGSFDDSFEGNEARFTRVEALLERLQDENNRRWRDKVTDVRRWFDFAASVVDRESGKVISVYQDSTGQSGGEKAKLAFTILVAAIAYQYDLDPDQPTRERFQFVLIDEMFSKVDDQHAEYAMELFKQFGLQLLIVAPLDAKARVTQPYVGCYLHVHKRDNRSEIYAMSAREFDGVVSSESYSSALQGSSARVREAV